MAAQIPTREPEIIVAGDTVKWNREDLTADYPASAGWSLSYELRSTAAAITIAATASGDIFQVVVSAATSAVYAAGIYAWAAFVAKGAERFRVRAGQLEVKPNLAAAGAADRRTHVKKVLDAIEAVLEARATRDQQEVSIEGRMLRYMPLPELLVFRSAYQAEYQRELAAERIAQGLSGRTRILTRFTSVG